MLCKMTWRFRTQHPRNRALVRQVNDLLDAQGNQSEYEGEQWFFLGLQMGLELGGLDRLWEL